MTPAEGMKHPWLHELQVNKIQNVLPSIQNTSKFLKVMEQNSPNSVKVDKTGKFKSRKNSLNQSGIISNKSFANNKNALNISNEAKNLSSKMKLKKNVIREDKELSENISKPKHINALNKCLQRRILLNENLVNDNH